MAVEIKVPALGESVTEATVAKWLVKAGDTVTIDQPLCELETDKVTVEVNASVAGSVVDLAVAEGTTIQVGGVLCHIEAGAAGAAAKHAASRRLPHRPAQGAPPDASRPHRPRGRRRAPPAGPTSQLRSATRKLVEDGIAPGDPAHRQGRSRHQGRRTGGAVIPGTARRRPHAVPLAAPARDRERVR
jgi:2-oxoglutarate dehydrogenase E2 component (dihydrolipoamide succinyltransferase)